MNEPYDPSEVKRAAQARESFSGRMLTDTQFEDAMAITGIIEREIKMAGKFREKLGDYAVAMARTEKFDAVKAETILRDLFTIRTGQPMNRMKEGLKERENSLNEEQKRGACHHAKEVGRIIQQGDKIPFHRAYASQRGNLAEHLGITASRTGTLMKDEFQQREGRDFYEWGKECEAKYYRPQIDAEKQQRAAERPHTHSRSRG